MIPEEIKSINMANPNERANLALQTKNKDILMWLSPDVDEMVIHNIIKNPNFDKEVYNSLNKEFINTPLILKELMNSNVLVDDEREKINNNLKKVQPFSDTFCPIPWNHLSTFSNGDLRACCQMIYEPYGRLYKNVKDVENLKELRNLPFLKELRRSMMKGEKHSACKQCWDEEENGLESRRIGQNNAYKSYNLLFNEYTLPDGTIDPDKIAISYFDLRLGNKCNLACVSCGPTDSSLWYKDYYEMTNGDKPIHHYGDKEYKLINSNGTIEIDSQDFNWPDSTEFLNKIIDNIRDVDRFYFTGGEPTINVNHINFLEKIYSTGYANRIKLDYNSNGISMPERLLNLWQYFGSVGIGFSIDATENHFEYIRYPGKWSKFIRTVKKIYKYSTTHKNIGCTLAPTISLFNITNILALQEFSMSTPECFRKEMPVHLLENPNYMNIRILSDNAKELISNEILQWLSGIHKIEMPFVPKNKTAYVHGLIQRNMLGIISYLNTPMDNREEIVSKFYKHIKFLDNQRNLNWENVFPRLKKLLQE